jgi:ribonuclease HI
MIIRSKKSKKKNIYFEGSFPHFGRNISERIGGRQTNNHAEILAAAYAIEAVKTSGKFQVELLQENQPKP